MTNSQDDVQGFDDAPKKAFKIPKWSIVTLIILAVLVVIALIVPSFLDQSKYKDIIIQKVAEQTGYTVSWSGDLGISVLPVPHVTIHDVTLANGTQKILSIKQADVSVELAPLFHKQVQVSSVKLVEPDISLIVDQSGRQTWMTDKLQAQKAETATPEASAPAEKSAQAFSLDVLHIEKGHIVYKDLSKASSQEVSNLDTDVKISELTGPFDVKADLVYNGNEISLKANAGKLETGKPTSIDADIELSKLNVKGSYKGEITTGDSLLVKGDLKLAAKDVEKTASALSKKDTKLPKGLNGALDLSTNVLYDGDTAALDNITIALGDLGYKGAVKVEGLKSSTTPKLNIDLASTKKITSGEQLVTMLSDLSVKGTGTYVNNTATIEQGMIQFAGQAIGLAGTYQMPVKANAKPVVNVKIQSGRLNLDTLTQKLGAQASSDAPTAVVKGDDSKTPVAIKGVSLPFDGNIQALIGQLNYGGKQYSNVNANIIANGNTLTISNVSLNTVADTSLKVFGSITDLNKLSGLDLTVNGKTGNVEELAKAFGKPLQLQQQVGAASLAGRFTGSLDNLAFNTTADALGFALTGIGNVKSVMATPQIDGLNIAVRHASVQTAVRNFSPAFTAPGSFNGPLNVSATVALKDKQYDVSNIKGSIGSTTIAGKISADMSGAKPSVKGDLSFGSMVFDTAAPQAGTTTASAKPSSAPATTSESRWSKDPIDTAWMNKFNADLSIKAASITQGLWKLVNANLAFKLNDGTLAINNMDANVFGGNVAINGTMKGGVAPLSMNWTAKASTINAQQMLSAIQNKQSDTLSGTIKSFDMNIVTSGNSAAALVNALNGKGSAVGSNLVIKGVDAAKLADAAKGSYKPLERAGSLFSSFKDGQTSFTDFNSEFAIANGVVTFSQLKFDGPQATLSSTGNVNLPRWTVDLKNNMTVKNSEVPAFDFTIQGPLDNPLQAGGSAIEGFLRQKAQAQVGKLIEDKLGKKLGLPAGILGGGTTTTTSPTATGTTAPATDGTAVPLTKEEKKAQQVQEGVKALQGLFGK